MVVNFLKLKTLYWAAVAFTALALRSQQGSRSSIRRNTRRNVKVRVHPAGYRRCFFFARHLCTKEQITGTLPIAVAPLIVLHLARP